MTPETSAYVGKARKLLSEAAKMLSVDLDAAAARTAYLAGFHAAQALISERLGRAVKTHRGVHSESHRLIKEELSFPDDLRAFLANTYDFKAVADYGISPNAQISPEEAKEALDAATRFVDCIDQLLQDPA